MLFENDKVAKLWVRLFTNFLFKEFDVDIAAVHPLFREMYHKVLAKSVTV